ncbi:MAG: DUF559 domain-containing protein [Actinomycetales bacterium]|nr:DUF559 domain-containing protein [Actinomycetales bacterium]
MRADLAQLLPDGFARREHLRALGATDRQLAVAVEQGALIRIRPGWYARAGVHPERQAAMSAGGPATCASELRARGVWTLERDRRVHAALDPHGHPAVARSQSIRVHWTRERTGLSGGVTLERALRDAAGCLTPGAVVAAIDSALHLGFTTPHRLTGIPSGVLDLVDGRAESGLESIARVRLARIGLSARPQARFAGVGRVDLLVEGRLVVETDGDEFHSSAVARRRDRARDAALAALGLPTLRFGAEQVLSSDPTLESSTLGMLARLVAVKDRGRRVARGWRRVDPRWISAFLHGAA